MQEKPIFPQHFHIFMMHVCVISPRGPAFRVGYIQEMAVQKEIVMYRLFPLQVEIFLRCMDWRAEFDIKHWNNPSENIPNWEGKVILDRGFAYYDTGTIVNT